MPDAEPVESPLPGAEPTTWADGAVPIHAVDPSPEDVLPLHTEELGVTRRIRRTLVRATRVTRPRDVVVEEDLAQEEICVRRVPVGRTVEKVPPVREEDDLVIIPVVEEVLVVKRRLVLKEEVHLRRIRRTRRHSETVRLREQDVVVTRVPLPD